VGSVRLHEVVTLGAAYASYRHGQALALRRSVAEHGHGVNFFCEIHTRLGVRLPDPTRTPDPQ